MNRFQKVILVNRLGGKIVSRWFLIAIFISSIIACKHSDKEAEMDFFLCIGQSNMAGRGELSANDTSIIKDVWLFNDQQAWEPAKNPLNKYSTIRKRLSIQKIGPAWSFAQRLSAKGRKIGLLVNARGGSSLNEWQKGGTYYNEAVMRALQAQKNGKLIGVLWHQGESDRNNWNSYEQKFKAFIEVLRKDLKAPSVPVVVGEIGNWKGTSDSINQVISNLKHQIPNLDFVEAAELSHVGDSIHFDRAAQIELGKRYAGKYLELENKQLK